MNQKWGTRQSLLLRAKDPTDHQAWEEFVHYYSQFIRMILHKMNFRGSDFGDIEQEILVKIWKNLPKFEINKERTNFRIWLSKLIRSTVIDYIRKSSSYNARQNKAAEFQVQESSLITQPELDTIVEHEWINYLTKAALENIREVFSEKTIRAFELSLAGKNSREIGEELQISHESVRTLKNRVKFRLIKEIEHLREELEF